MSVLFLLILAAGPSEDPFGPLSALIGTDWIAEMPREMTDTQRFEKVYGGKFIRNRHWVKDKNGRVVYEGETFYAWDAQEEKVKWFYFNSTGGHIVGEIWQEDDAWIAHGVNHAGGTQPAEVRSKMIPGDDSWQMVQLFSREGTWVEQMRVTFTPVE